MTRSSRAQAIQGCQFCGRPQGSFCELAGIGQAPPHLAAWKQTRMPSHQIIFAEGSPCLALYCIHTGRVKLYKTGTGGELQIIRLLGPGDILGYRGLLAREPYSATAETLEPTTLCVIPKEEFLELLALSPELCLRLLTKLAKEMRISEEMALTLKLNTLLERTARLLLFLMAASGGEGTDPGAAIQVPLLRSEMAQMVGAAPESFSRTLSRLASHGVLQITRKEILILDRRRLETIARG